MAEYRIFNNPSQISQGISIATAYNEGTVKGWDGELAEEAFRIVGSKPGSKVYTGLPDDLVSKYGGERKAFLYQVTRKLLNKDTPNYPQQIGDCVSFGAKNAIEYLACYEKLISGDREYFRHIFPPYLYGTGRVYVGGNQIRGDGSLGSWMAEAVIKYGTIPSDAEGVPGYSGSVARDWGSRSGASYLNKFKPLGQKHLIKSAAKITRWEELVAAIANGYPCTIGSNQGFNMEASSDGFHRASGRWAHQMCIVGVDDTYSEPYALILNSWGDVHGRLKSFHDSNENLPVGIIRAKKSTIQSMIQDECYVFSQFDGFPETGLDEALFKIVGS